MSFQVPKWEEPKEIMAKKVCFWHKPYVIKRLDTICDISHVDRSKVLRLLVDFFLNDIEFQDRVMEGIKNNG